MKKVFQLAYALNLAGTETVFMNWYRNIDRTRLQFDFGVMQQYNTPLVDEIVKLGGRIFIIPAGHGLVKRLKLLYGLYRTLKQYGPYDVFQTHDHFFAGLTCMSAWLAGVPKRVTISHFADGAKPIGLLHKMHRAFSRLFIFCFATTRLAVSQKAGKTLYGNHISFKIINNGIDSQKFAYNAAKRQEMRQKLGLTDRFVVGHIGRFAPEKNHTFLLDVFAKIYQQNPKAYLILLGEGPLKEQIRTQVKKAGLENAVLFANHQQAVQDWYQCFDVFVLPSLFEGLGIVALEAQCSGLPCFLSDIIPHEAAVCNTVFLPIDKGPAIWAERIVQPLPGFIRKDESERIRQAGFDMVQVGRFIQNIYLEK